MAATDEEDEVVYENLNKKNSYDEITMNFGRPVIQIPDPKEEDIFASISFSSPIEDLKPMTPPIPAPRLSKQKSSKQILSESENQEVILQVSFFFLVISNNIFTIFEFPGTQRASSTTSTKCYVKTRASLLRNRSWL